MNKVTFFSGNKGGVGKSFLANTYADILKYSKNKNIVIIEADTENPDVARMWSKHATVKKVNLFKREGWLDLVDAIDADKDAEFIVSLPAQIGTALKENLAAFKVMLSELGVEVELNMFFVMSVVIDSVQLAKRALHDLSGTLDNFDIVLNGAYGNHEDFLAWHESKVKTEILKAGKEIYVEKLITRTTVKIFHTLLAAKTVEPFTLRRTNTELGLTASEKISIKMYLNAAEKAFFK
ncbi:TPA: hypothetical protein ACN30T_004411 [Vibrio parahaemolyticus]